MSLVVIILSCIFGALYVQPDSSLKNIWLHDVRVARVSAQNVEVHGVMASNIDFPEDAAPSKEHVCDFGGQTLKVAVRPQPPFVNCLQDGYGDWLCNGSNIEAVDAMAKRFNFRPDWLVLAGDQFDSSSLAKNASFARADSMAGELSGVLSLVRAGRALMSANGIMRTEAREKSLFISEPFDAFRIHFLMSKSVREHDHIFIKPFSLQAWLAILFSASMIVPIFYLINTTTSYYHLRKDKFLARMSVWTCLHFYMRKYLSHGRCSVGPKSGHSGESSSDSEFEKIVGSPAKYELSLMTRTSLQALKQKRKLIKQQWSIERRRARQMTKLSSNSGFFKMAYIVWYVVSSLANQGGETEDLPRANSTRILVAFWWLYMIVVCAIHSGILTAILTFPKQNDYIQTLDDYLRLDTSEKAAMRLSVDKQNELAYFLSQRENWHKSPLQSLTDQTENPVIQVDFHRHRERILDDVHRGRIALMEEKSIIDQIITQEYFDQKPPRCLFKSSRFPVDLIPMSFVLSKQMSQVCRDSINSLLRYIMKTGLAIKWRRRYEAQGNDCLNTVIINAGDVDKIELRHVEIAFWLLAFGLLLGFIVFLSEIVWLLTIDDYEEDGASSSGLSSSSSGDPSDSSSSDEPGRLKLGHRGLRQNPVRSVDIKSRLKRLRGRQRNMGQAKQVPRIVLPGESDSDISLDQTIDIPRSKALDKKRRREAKIAQRRSRRVRRTLDLVKKLNKGRIYSDKFKLRVRRASQVVAGRSTYSQNSNELETNAVLRHRSANGAKVLPI